MAWSLHRSISPTQTIYKNVISMEALLGHPVTTRDEIATIAQDMKASLPEDLYKMNMQWLEQIIQQFANDTKDIPPYLKKVFCNAARGVSLYDNTRCINCCNRFVHNLFAACKSGHCFVVMERIDDGMVFEVMDCASFMDKYGPEVHYIIEQSLIHHAEEAEEAAD